MIRKIFKAAWLLSALFLITFLPLNARASDQNLFVYYGCDAIHNRLTVKTFVADKKPWQTKPDDLYFLWAEGVGMSLECPFMSGDRIYVQSYYGDKFSHGGYRHVALYINNYRLDRLLEFDPDHTQAMRIKSDGNHRIDATYSQK